MPSATDLVNQFRLVNDIASQEGVRPELVHAIIGQESGGNPQARSRVGAMGLMQLMPETAKEMGVTDPNDPEQNIRGGVRYFKKLLDHYKDEKLALAAYNAGPGNVDKYKGVPPFAETQKYVPSVQNRAAGITLPPPPASALAGASVTVPAGGASAQLPAAPAAPTQSATDLVNEFRASQAPPPTSGREDGFLGNVIKSGEHFLTGVGQAVAHPINTAADLASTVVGAAQSALPSSATTTLAAATGNPALDKRKYAQAFGDFYKNRYGSLEGIKRTAYEDPVGMAADAAGLLTGGGEALDLANVVAKSGRLGQIADVAKTAGTLVDPLRLPTNVGRAVIQAPAEEAARRIITSNVKPSRALTKANPNVDLPGVILNEGFGPGKRGAEQADALVDNLNDKVQNLVTRDALSGRTYDLRPILKNLSDLEAEYHHQAAPEADLAAVRSAREQLMNNPVYSKDVVSQVPTPQSVQVPHPSATTASGQPVMQTTTQMVNQPQVVGRTTVPQDAVELNRFKKNTYQGLKGKYGVEKSGAIEADKAAARGAKEILDTIPGVPQLQKREGDAIVARQALTDMGLRESNKYPFGLMDLVAAGAAAGGHMVAGPIAAIPPLIAAVLKHPTTAFPIARGLHRVGTASIPFEPLVRNITPAAQVEGAVKDVRQRQVSKDELIRRYQAYLATQGAQ